MSTVNEAQTLIGNRLAELDEERRRLERALAELGAVQRPQRRSNKKKGKVGDEALAVIAKNPGINATEIAKQLAMGPNYLYRVLADLEKAGRVKKDARNYWVRGAYRRPKPPQA